MIDAAVNIRFGSRPLFAIQHFGFVSQDGEGMPPPPAIKNRGLRNVANGGVGLPPPPATQNNCFASGCLEGGSPPRRFPCSVTWQTRLLCDTADMSAVSANRSGPRLAIRDTGQSHSEMSLAHTHTHAGPLSYSIDSTYLYDSICRR